MSVLTKKQILEAVNKGEISFTPNLDSFQMSGVSLDLRIGWSFYIPQTWRFTDKGRVAIVADYSDTAALQENFQLIKLSPGQYCEILPGESIIASTLEKVSINTGRLTGVIHPRSSSSRRGLSIQSGLIDPFYSGFLVIPMRNDNDHVLRIYPGERVCQMMVYTTTEEVSREDADKHGQNDPKYYAATPYNLGIKPDPQSEILLLREGNINKIKQEFSIIKKEENVMQ